MKPRCWLGAMIALAGCGSGGPTEILGSVPVGPRCGDGVVFEPVRVSTPFGWVPEQCDDGAANGMAGSFCTPYCQNGHAKVTEDAFHDLPKPAPHMLVTTHLVEGTSLVTWDDEDVTVVLGVDTEAPRTIALRVAAPPSGVALTPDDEALGGQKVVWMETFSDEVSATKIYLADVRVDPPVITELGGYPTSYPFPDAAGGVLARPIDSRLAVIDTTRGPSPEMLVAAYDFTSSIWTEHENMGPAPGATPTAAAMWTGETAVEWNLVRTFAGPSSYALDELRGLADVGPRGPLDGVPVATSFGAMDEANETQPVVLFDDGTIVFQEPDLSWTVFGRVPAGSHTLGVINVAGGRLDDVVVLKDDGVLSVLINDGDGRAMPAQDFPVFDAPGPVALTADFDRIYVSAGATFKALTVAQERL